MKLTLRPHSGYTPEQRQALIESLANRLARRDLAAPAVFALEVARPFSFLIGQGLLFAQPLLGLFVGDGRALDLAMLLEDPASVELLIRRIEQVDEAEGAS
jgi:hypothetical protein